MTDTTRPRTPGTDPGATLRPTCAYLYLVIDAAHPGSGGSRHALVDLDKISLGRGPERLVARTERSLVLSVPDDWMSRNHAQLHIEHGQWNVIDTGSMNGVRVNGAPHRRAILRDGDLIELGHTFFVFRAAQQRVEPHDLASNATPAPAGFTTLLPDLAEMFGEIARLAPSNHAILIQGPTGSGKELAALAVHQLSQRRGEFVAVNCGALPVGLVESTLFGHVKGAFTGAVKTQVGLVESSQGGTLFLDEIGDLPLAAQAALLRVLEYGVLPIGAKRTVAVDLRVIAATHKDLDAMVRERTFRIDLHARLQGTTVELPRLAHRREDFGLVVASVLARMPATNREVTFTDDAMRLLLQYHWPQNIRELVKCLEHAVLVAGSGTIDSAHLPRTIATPPPTPPPLSDGEPGKQRPTRDQIVAQLDAHHGNISRTARALGVTRPVLKRLAHRYGIDPKQLRP